MIAAIILVVAEPYIPHMADILPKTQKPFILSLAELASGFGSRWFDRLAGLKNYQNIDYVAIHDAVRPLVPADLLNNLIATIANNKDGKLKNEIIGAVPVLPLADSIKTIDKGNSDNNPTNSRGLITGGIDRSQLAAAQTPQLFRRDIITKLHDDFAGKSGFTDDCTCRSSWFQNYHGRWCQTAYEADRC